MWDYEDENFRLADTPPHSLEAEMCALGSAMVSRFGVEAILELLPDPVKIYHPAHREIHAAVIGLASEGVEVDLVTVKNWLVSKERLPNAGGIEYLINLNEVVPTASNARHYCTIVQDYATLRELQAAGKKIVTLVNDPELDVSQKVEAAHALVSVASVRKGAGVTAENIDLDSVRMVVPWQLGKIGFETDSKLRHIQSKLYTATGGLFHNQVTTIEAPTGVGKSWAAQQTCINLCRLGYRCRIIQLADMTETDVAHRMIAMMSGVPYKPKPGTEGYERWMESETEFRSWGDRFEIYDSSARGNSDTVQDIVPWVKQRQRVCPADVVFWDYVQMLRWRGRSANLTEELNFVSREIESLARSEVMIQSATVILSQINEKGDTQYSTQPEKIAAVRVQITKSDDEDWLKWTIKKHRFKPTRGWSGEWLRDPRGQFYDR